MALYLQQENKVFSSYKLFLTWYQSSDKEPFKSSKVFIVLPRLLFNHKQHKIRLWTNSFLHNSSFLCPKLKNIIQIQHTSENFPLWKSHIQKLFRANGFHGYWMVQFPLNLTTTNTLNFTIQSPNYDFWILIDQNLASYLLSTGSPSILSYVINLDSCVEIWITFNRHMQSTNRAHLI